MTIKPQARSTIGYDQNQRPVSNSREEGKILGVQNTKTCPDAHQIPTATVPARTGFGEAMENPCQMDQTGSVAESTKAVVIHPLTQAAMRCS